MRWMSRLIRRLRAPARRAELDRAMDEEMRFHVEMEAQEIQRLAGVSPDEARRRALASFGGVTRFQEEGRETLGVQWLDGVTRDVRFALRSLRRSPGFGLTAMLTLGVGMALTLTVFSLVYAGLLRGLPYEESDRLVRVVRSMAGESRFLGASGADYEAWRVGQRSFTHLAASYAAPVVISGPERTDPARASTITANTFAMLGVRPMLGRDFTTDDERLGAPGVVILSHALWSTRYGSDTTLLGRTLRVNGAPHVVVGVMPPRFGFPRSEELWLNFQMDPRQVMMSPVADRGPLRQMLRVYGRLRPGVSVAAADAELDAITRRVQAEYGRPESRVGAAVQPAEGDLARGGLLPLLPSMMLAVLCVLLIACANVANLLLDRAVHRTREVGVRVALGASRGAVVRQFLAEALVVALGGTIVGVLAAHSALGVFNRASAGQNFLPFYVDVGLHPAVLGVAAALALACAGLAGALPAWGSSRVDVGTVLKDASRSASSLKAGRVSRAIVAFEIALSCVLLVGAGLTIKSVARGRALAPGFATEGLFTAHVGYPPTHTDTAAQQVLFATLRERLAALPGVRAVSLGSTLPGVYQNGASVALEGAAPPADQGEAWVFTTAVSPDFFTTFEIPVTRGRAITTEDGPRTLSVAVVSQDWVDRFLPGQDPVGRRIRLEGETASRTIVGVVPPTWSYGWGVRRRVYLPLAQAPAPDVSIALRTGGDPRALEPVVRRAVRALDGDMMMSGVQGAYTMADFAQRWMFQTRLFANIFAALGILALALASVGLYGVTAFAVSRRTRELGIRMALGARAATVMGMVARQAALQIALGLVAGLAVAAAAGRLIGGLLFEVRPVDPPVYLVVAAVLAGAGLLASIVPAQRATRVDPLVALRSE